MQTDEWKPGEIVVEKDSDSPTRFLVAAAAILAQIPLMDIAHLVAVETGGIERMILRGAGMTDLAIQVRVRTLQREISVFLVVEGDSRPFQVVMAGAAFGTIPPLVNVVSQVTAGAFPGQWRIKNISLMTAVANYLRMPALEGKTTCISMVKG